MELKSKPPEVSVDGGAEGGARGRLKPPGELAKQLSVSNTLSLVIWTVFVLSDSVFSIRNLFLQQRLRLELVDKTTLLQAWIWMVAL